MTTWTGVGSVGLLQEFWQRPVLPQLAAEIDYVMGMTMRRRMRKRGNIWMRKARMMMRKKIIKERL